MKLKMKIMRLSIYALLFLIIFNSCHNKTNNKDISTSQASYIYNHESFARRSNDSPIHDDFVVNHSTYYKHRYYQPVYPVKLETYENGCLEFQNFIAQHGHSSSYRPLIGIVTEDPNDVLAVNQLLVRVQENIENKKQMRLITDEILTKVIAYRNLQVGQKIPVPIVPKSGDTRIVIYHVDKVFDLNAEMPAFGLVPSDIKAPPILLFRGTDLSFTLKGMASVFADLDLNGPGLSIFYMAQDDLHNWLEKVSNSHSKARIMGYSLGGSFTQYTCIHEHELICKDKQFPSVAFNQPGISEDLVIKWHKLKEEEKPPLKGYVTEGDMVSTVGKLIGNVKEISLDYLLEPLFAHVTLMSVQQRLYVYRLDVTLKNELDYSATSQATSESAPEK